MSDEHSSNARRGTTVLRSDAESVDAALDRAAKRSELVAAGVRVAIALVLLVASILIQPSAGSPGHPLQVLSFVYLAIGALGLLLTWGGAFGRVAAYAFAALDVSAIATALVMQSHMPFGIDASEFRVVLFALLFVLLIHSALRQRPYVSIFAIAAFFIAYLSAPWIMAMFHAAQMHALGTGPTGSSHLGGETLLVFTLVAMAAAILHYLAVRARDLTRDAVTEGHRAAQLSRYFSPEVAAHLGEMDFGRAASGRRCRVGVIFVDIRDFTRLSEQASPDELAELLASFREVVSEVIFKHGGIVDKFVGDAVLAVFGTLRSMPDDAERTVLAALDICRAVEVWRRAREQSGKLGVRVGVGAHFGDVFAGVIPSGAMFEHSVIGDSVNLAQRIERLTRTLDCDVVLSEDLVRAGGVDTQPINFTIRPDVSVPGHHAPLNVYSGDVI